MECQTSAAWCGVLAALVAYGCHRKGSRYRRRDFVWGRKVTSYKLQVSVEREGLGWFGVQAEDRPTNRPTNRPIDRPAAKQSKASYARLGGWRKHARRDRVGLPPEPSPHPNPGTAWSWLSRPLFVVLWYALVLLWPCRLACMFKHVVVSCPVYVYMRLRGAEDMPTASLSGRGVEVCVNRLVWSRACAAVVWLAVCFWQKEP